MSEPKKPHPRVQVARGLIPPFLPSGSRIPDRRQSSTLEHMCKHIPQWNECRRMLLDSGTLQHQGVPTRWTEVLPTGTPPNYDALPRLAKVCVRCEKSSELLDHLLYGLRPRLKDTHGTQIHPYDLIIMHIVSDGSFFARLGLFLLALSTDRVMLLSLCNRVFSNDATRLDMTSELDPAHQIPDPLPRDKIEAVRMLLEGLRSAILMRHMTIESAAGTLLGSITTGMPAETYSSMIKAREAHDRQNMHRAQSLPLLSPGTRPRQLQVASPATPSAALAASLSQKLTVDASPRPLKRESPVLRESPTSRARKSPSELSPPVQTEALRRAVDVFADDDDDDAFEDPVSNPQYSAMDVSDSEFEDDDFE